MTQAPAAQVLLVEDDPSLRMVTRLACESAGFGVREAATGADALIAAITARPDVVLLDLTLPDMDGFDVCRALRQHDAALPIIMVTARGAEVDKVVGLELGADDYLTKPFSTRELIARIRARLRHSRQTTDGGQRTSDGSPSDTLTTGNGAATAAEKGERLVVGPLQIAVDEREVFVHGQRVALTRTEFEILQLLARQPGRAYSREQIITAIWGYDADGADRIVDSHVKNLRRKLAAASATGHQPGPLGPQGGILTVPQVGYKLSRELGAEPAPLISPLPS